MLSEDQADLALGLEGPVPVRDLDRKRKPNPDRRQDLIRLIELEKTNQYLTAKRMLLAPINRQQTRKERNPNLQADRSLLKTLKTVDTIEILKNILPGEIDLRLLSGGIFVGNKDMALHPSLTPHG